MTKVKNNIARFFRYYIYSAAAILLLTGIAKIYSAIGTGEILLYPDPIFGLKFKDLFLFVGCIEIVVSVFCMILNGIIERALLIIWLCFCFIIYRLGSFTMGYHKPCKCLGDIASRLNISDSSADLAMIIILFYLTVGSCYILYINKEKVINIFGN